MGLALLLQKVQKDCQAAGGSQEACRELALKTGLDFQDGMGDAAFTAAGLLIDLIPIIGDIKGAYECTADPSVLTCGAAFAGIIPIAGDMTKIVLKKGDQAVTVVKDGDKVVSSAPATADEIALAVNTGALPIPRRVGNLQGGPLENATQVTGRFQTSGGPINGAVYRADDLGNITSYATYDRYGNITSRVDVDPSSAPHFDKITGQTIPAPHVVDYPSNTLPDGSVRTQTNAGVYRPAIPSDMP